MKDIKGRQRLVVPRQLFLFHWLASWFAIHVRWFHFVIRHFTPKQSDQYFVRRPSSSAVACRRPESGHMPVPSSSLTLMISTPAPTTAVVSSRLTNDRPK